MNKNLERNKFWRVVVGAFISALIWTACTTTSKLIVASNITVDHAMQAWAVHVVDGKATPAQEDAVRQAKLKYDAAEDALVEANIKFAQTDKSAVKLAREYLKEQREALIVLIQHLIGKKVS